MKNQIIILAGGKGTRMESEIPKVLHKVGNKTMLDRIIEAAKATTDHISIIIGHKGQEIKDYLGNNYSFIMQEKQIGTGHAIICAKNDIKVSGADNVIVLPGDHPCVSAETIKELVELHRKDGATITIRTAEVPNYFDKFANFYGCGRILRDQNQKLKAIKEVKECIEEEKNLKEVNVSYYCFDTKWLLENIDKLNNENSAQEYYITDLIKMGIDQNKIVNAYKLKNPIEGLGVNSQEELQLAAKQL